MLLPPWQSSAIPPPHHPANGTRTRFWGTSPSSTPPLWPLCLPWRRGRTRTYDNRISLDPWTIDRVITLAGGNAGLRDRIRVQGDALCALAGAMLSEAELDTPVPARLLSNDAAPLDQPVPLRDLITGLADVELPGHAAQLLTLLPEGAEAEAMT